MTIIRRPIDLSQPIPPEVMDDYKNGDQHALGDLHGNALKLLWAWLQEGFFSFEGENDYYQFFQIYYNHSKLLPLSREGIIQTPNKGSPEYEKLRSDIYRFKKLIPKLKVNPAKKEVLLLLIGDELFDRGSNDYFTLKLIEKACEGRLTPEILLSNHGIEALISWEQSKKFPGSKKFTMQLIKKFQAFSGPRLQVLIDLGFVTEKEITDLFENIYKPCLRLLSYSIDKKEDKESITLFSHAPIDLKVIKSLARKFKVPYQDATAQVLAETIDQINNKFQDSLKSGEFIKLYDSAMYETRDYNNYPLEFLVWNRDYTNLDRPASTTKKDRDYSLSFAHGHTEDPCVKSGHIFSLDEKENLVGKFNKDPRLGVLDEENVLYVGNISTLKTKASRQPKQTFEEKDSTDVREQKPPTSPKAHEETTRPENTDSRSIGTTSTDRQLEEAKKELKATLTESPNQEASNILHAVTQVEPRMTTPDDKKLVTKALKCTTTAVQQQLHFTDPSPTPGPVQNLTALAECANKIKRKSWGKIVAGCILGFIGAAIFSASLAALIMSLGSSSIVSALGIKFGSTLVTLALSQAIVPMGLSVSTLGGLGIFAAGVKLVYDGKEKVSSDNNPNTATRNKTK